MAKILIVEDDKDLNEAYEMILKKQNYKVRVVFNGEEGLKAFKKDPPDIVLLDLRMPKMDGISFLKKLAPAKNYPNTNIIIFSNFDDQTEIDKAFGYGATRYILKAWSSPKELLKIVEDTLAGKSQDFKAKSH